FSGLSITTAGTGYKLHAVDGGLTASDSSTFNITAGSFTKHQLLVPGETAAPGTASRKSGTPDPQTAGTVFKVTGNGVDTNWNAVSSTDTVHLTSTDADATLGADAPLAAGTVQISATLVTVGSQTITASAATDNTKTANTSASITVNAGPFAKLQLLLPGEIAAPGTATGKTGTPNPQTAGTAFNVTIRAVDANWNLVTTVTDTTSLNSTDPNTTMPA